MKDSLALALYWAKDLMKDWVDNDPAVCLLLGQGNSRHQPWALPAGGWQVDTGSNVAVIPVDDMSKSQFAQGCKSPYSGPRASACVLVSVVFWCSLSTSLP